MGSLGRNDDFARGDLSAIGALNGWTLLMGQVPMAAARDKLFPLFSVSLSPRACRPQAS